MIEMNDLSLKKKEEVAKEKEEVAKEKKNKELRSKMNLKNENKVFEKNPAPEPIEPGKIKKTNVQQDLDYITSKNLLVDANIKNKDNQNFIMKKINEFTNKIIPDDRIPISSVGDPNKSIFSKLKTPQIFFIITLLIIILIIIVSILLFNNDSFTFSNQSNMITKYVFYCLMFISVIIGLSILLLPTFKDLKTFIFQLKDLGFIIFYIIFLILFFNLLPSNILTNYAFLITPVSILIAIYLFYKGFQTKLIQHFNINYERIKYIILSFCLITLFILYYHFNPGGYVKQFFGHYLILTILLSVFSFLYLVVLLTIPDKTSSNKGTNFLQNFSMVSIVGVISFLIFLVFITVTLVTYKGGFFETNQNALFITLLILFIFILWSSMLVINLFPEIRSNEALEKTNLFKRSLLMLFGLIISGIIIAWLVNSIHHLTGQSSIISLVLNLLFVLVILSLIYKTIYVEIPNPALNKKKAGFFNIITNLLFYIPCLFIGSFDSIMPFFINEYNSTTTGSLMLLLLAIILLVLYFTLPLIEKNINLQGGKLLVNQPVYTDEIYSLGTYEQLNGNDNFNYQYSLCFWVYIDSSAPNTNLSYEKYTSLLNFGNKPNILYKASTHTLMIVMDQPNLKSKNNVKLLDFDDNGYRILYKSHDFLLQKWNNIIINYNGGTLDIFINGDLVKSTIEVVPYFTLDALTIGENNGINGGICNVSFFNKTLTRTNIYYLYNMIKDKNPPIGKVSNETIIKIT